MYFYLVELLLLLSIITQYYITVMLFFKMYTGASQ